MASTATGPGKSPLRIAAGKASQRPEVLALRIKEAWADLTPDRQQIIAVTLVPLLCAERGEPL